MGLSESKSVVASFSEITVPATELLKTEAPSSGWIATTQSPSTSRSVTSSDCNPSDESQVSMTFPNESTM